MLSRVLKIEHYRKYFFNTGWLLAEKVIRIISNILVGAIVARYLGPANYGLLNYALTYIAFFIPVASLGLGDIVIREYLRNTHKENEILGTAMYLRFFSSFLMVSLILIGILFSDNEPITNTLIVITSITIIFQSFDVLDRFFQAKTKARTTVKAYMASFLVCSAIKIILVLCNSPLVYFGVVQVLEIGILASAWVFYFQKHDRKISNFYFNPKLALGFIKESGILVLSSLMIVLYTRIDQVMIKNMLDNTSLGNFSAAVKLSESYYFIPGIILNSLFPAILYGKSVSELEYNKRLQRLYDLMTFCSVPIAILVSLFSDQIASLAFGPKYQHVGAVLSLHVWAGVFVFWGSVCTKWFVVEKIPAYITFNTALGGVINIGLNFFLIPRYGIIGAASATLVAQSIATFLSLSLFKRTRPLFLITLQSINPIHWLSYLSNLKSIKIR